MSVDINNMGPVSRRLQDEIDNVNKFVDSYKAAKNRPPERVLISKEVFALFKSDKVFCGGVPLIPK